MAETGARAVALVLHDVAPSTWPLFEDFVAAVDGLGDIPLTLLVVPDFHRQGRLDSQPAFVKIMHATPGTRRRAGPAWLLPRRPRPRSLASAGIFHAPDLHP